MMKPINILVIDDDNLFFEIFKECIYDSINKNVTCIMDHIDDPSNIDYSKDYSIYIIDNKFHGRDMCFEIIDQIRENDPDARIFAATGYGDFDLIKNLWSKHIEGFIDKNDSDCSSLINMIEILYKNQEIMKNLENKVNQISIVSKQISGV